MNAFHKCAALVVTATCFLAATLASAETIDVQATVRADQPGPVVSRNLFGQFAEHLGYGIYGGIWVGENSKIPNTRGYRNDVVAALKRLEIPVVRWPGGCFADEYHWREGIGPRDKRPVRVNTHWGGVEEPNSFGTHEFLDFAELIGADAYVSGNVGDASPDEMAQWVEYITSDTNSSLANERRKNGRDKPWKLAYFGVGNELWGCGGNMRVEYAADLYRRYQTFVKVPRNQATKKIGSGANVDDYHWTEVMMSQAGKLMDGLSIHYYTSPGPTWESKRSSTDFGESEWIETLSKARFMDELVTKHSAIMDKYDPQKKVGMMVDEWGTWYTGLPGINPGFLYQQNSMRDAIVAAIHINLFSRHADRVKMANIAQMVNVLQAMILTQDEKMVLTPTYHVFDMYKPFKDATYLPVEVDTPMYRHSGYIVPAVDVAAVSGKDGKTYVAFTNLDPNRSAKIATKIVGTKATSVTASILSAPAMNTVNTFTKPDSVKPQNFTGAKLKAGELSLELPAKSVVMIALH